MILSEKDLLLLSSMPVSVPEERRENDLKIEFDGTTVLCRVCGDKASGFHYGVHSCEGCKGFFRRSIQQKIQYRPCTKNQQCSILRINRNRCQYCRLKKCIAVGMSRDAVRFGRVPKREKAKILAAMQKVNACSQEKALGAELEDELRLMTMIVRAHDETCEFTKDKVTTLIENASREATSPYPMACPLNPAPHLLENGRMETFSERFAPAIQGVVEFAKRCPAFGFLSQEDQVTLLRASVFEVLLVRLACMFDSQAKTLVSLNGQILRRDHVSNANNGRFLMDSMFEFAERLNAIGLSDSEVGLFCAVVVITTDRPGLRNIDLVSRIQSKLTNILRKAVIANHAENPNAFEQLMNTIPDLRTLNALHSEKLQLKEVEPHTGKAAGAIGKVTSSQAAGTISQINGTISQFTGTISQFTGTMSQVNGAIETATSMAPPLSYSAIPHDLWSQYALMAPHPPCLAPEEGLMRSSSPGHHSQHNNNSNGSEWSTHDFTKDDHEHVGSPTSTGSGGSNSPVLNYPEDAKSPPTRTFVDGPKSPPTRTFDGAQSPPTRNFANGAQSPPSRIFVDGPKSPPTRTFDGARSPPTRNFADGAQSPPSRIFVSGAQSPPSRTFVDGAKSPPSSTFVDRVKSPVRSYMEGAKSPYSEDCKSPVRSFPSPPRYVIEEAWPSEITQTVAEYSQNIPKKPGSDNGSSSGDEGCFADSPMKATMYPKLLRVDSPTDSGIDSGKEHGASTSPTLSLCSSPHSSSSIEDKMKDVMEHNNVPEKHESIEDMPVLKRALQAPPIINPNMLMDEAYRHHKKFRAARREAEGPSSPSQMSLASTHSTLVKTLEQAPRYLSEQQLKRTDLIHNIIMQKETLPGQQQTLSQSHESQNNHYSFSNSRSSPNTTYTTNGHSKNLLVVQNGYYGNNNNQYSSWPFQHQPQQTSVSPVQQQYEHISSQTSFSRAGSPRVLYNPRSPQTCTSPLVMNGICQSDARLHHSEAMHKDSQPLNLSKKLFTAPLLKMES